MIIIGDTGKFGPNFTNIRNRQVMFAKAFDVQYHDVTVGVDFGSYLIRVEDVLYKLQIWDTAG
jgi:GTPase SAR1 family protein